MKKLIYLDYNATTPHDTEVISAMKPYLEEYFGNPSSSHLYGLKTGEAVEQARCQVASLLNCRPSEIIFTSGGTESNNYAIKGIAFAHRHKGKHIITTVIEHPAVLEVCRFLEKQGFYVTYLPVDEYGLVNISELENAITDKTILVSVMHANNEVGTVQPIEEISAITKKKGIVFHTDAAQSAGKISIDVKELGVELLSIAGHKLYAPKGIGVLYIKDGIKPERFMHGAGHEGGRRAGTENVLEIVGLGKACEIAGRDLKKNSEYMKQMRDRLHRGLEQRIKDIKLNGHREKRLPNTLSLSFKGINSSDLIHNLNDKLAVSAGAACHTGKISYVLEAMNIPYEWSQGTVRFSTGKMTEEIEIDRAVDIISSIIIS
ncbi:MAG: cysteine desulfurase family protein [Candidatus Eremiobacterota bacterium]